MASTLVLPAQQPDIEYTPNIEKWKSRTRRRLETEELPRELPPDFPKKLSSDLVWEGGQLRGVYDWTYELNDAELNELENALAHFQSLKMPLGYISQDTFPLPSLHEILRDISKELHHGHGFKVIRGLPVDKHSCEENVILYVGISSHIAPARGRQDSWFNHQPADVVLSHIKDLSNTVDKDMIGAPAYTTAKQVFHTDAGDIVALFALNTASEGGQSWLASSWRVYNELAETRPDLIQTLAGDWPFDEFGNPKIPYQSRPLLFYQPSTDSTPERVLIQYARRSFTGYQALSRSPGIPSITEAQAEALDTLHFLADKFRIALDFQKGDIQYINNLSIFHARGEFTDSPEQQRHLLRLWLRDPANSWETPVALQPRWSGLYDNVTPEKQVFPLEPTIRSASHRDRKKLELNQI